MGGVDPNNSFRAQTINSKTGAADTGGDIPFANTLAAAGITLGAALGLPTDSQRWERRRPLRNRRHRGAGVSHRVVDHRGFVAASFVVVAACSSPDPPAASAPVDAAVTETGGSVTAIAPRRRRGDAESRTFIVVAGPYGYIRFANWINGPQSLDACVAQHGQTTFQGPLLATRGAALPPVNVSDAGFAPGDAGPPGLAFPEVSQYFAVPAGSYDVRFRCRGCT